MAGILMPQFETIYSRGDNEVLRMEVPGGWIYLYRELGFSESSQPRISMVFVPDPKERT